MNDVTEKEEIWTVEKTIKVWKETKPFQTNEQAIASLSTEALAWFLMLHTDSGMDSCSICTHKDLCFQNGFYETVPDAEKPEGVSCIEGHTAWLNREPTDADLKIFATAIWNYQIGLYNASLEEHNMADSDYVIVRD